MAKKCKGIKHIKGDSYRIDYQVGKNRVQRRIRASSLKEAKIIRDESVVELRRQVSLPQTEKERSNATFGEAWEKLNNNLLSNNLTKKTRGGIRCCYNRLFRDFREKEFPGVKSFKDLSLSYFVEYKAYYAVRLNRQKGLRSELSKVKSIMHKLNDLQYCSKTLIEELKKIKKPPSNKKDYPEISRSNIEKLLRNIKRDREDYYNVIYFIYRTGRRRKETTLIEKNDVISNGFKPLRVNIRAETTKKNTAAPLEYLDDDLEKHIRRALSNNRTTWLFPNRLGNKCTPNRVCDYLKRKSKEIIGIEITPHYFRHRLCTECGNKNIPIADVKAITGIRDTKVLLEYYSHKTKEGQKQVLEMTK